MYDELNENNFLVYAAKHYTGFTTEEFIEDLNRLKYIKKLITRYIENKDLKERLILNHIIILNNVFGPDVLCKMLFLKLRPQMKYIKPFLILINVLPEIVYNVGNEKVIDTNTIDMDINIINKLRNI